jgi:hypothetical protein
MMMAKKEAGFAINKMMGKTSYAFRSASKKPFG